MPIAKEFVPCAMVLDPKAVEFSPLAVDLSPKAVESFPLATDCFPKAAEFSGLYIGSADICPKVESLPAINPPEQSNILLLIPNAVFDDDDKEFNTSQCKESEEEDEINLLGVFVLVCFCCC